MGGAYEWPSVSSIQSYRQQVRKVILDVIETVELDLPVKIDTPLVMIFTAYYTMLVHFFFFFFAICIVGSIYGNGT